MILGNPALHYQYGNIFNHTKATATNIVVSAAVCVIFRALYTNHC